MTATTPQRDPLDNYVQNIIRQHHIDLSTRLPSFHTDQYTSHVQPPLIPLPRNPVVGIIGGGIGGLYAAMLLQSQGIPYEILEASNDIGGRLFTYPFSKQEHDYYDVGAMRFPDTPIMKTLTDLFQTLEREEGLKRVPYYFTDKYGNSTLRYNDIVRQRSDKIVVPDDFRVTGVPAQPWGNIGVGANVSNVVDPFKKALEDDIEHGGTKGWELMMKYDIYSTRAYMAGRRSDYQDFLDVRKLMPYPTEVVNWCETFDKSTGWYDRALTETVLEDLAFKYYEDQKKMTWTCVDGGSNVLAKTLDRYLSKRPGYTPPRLNTRVTAIEVHKLPSGETGLATVRSADGKTRTYAHVITTCTLPCLRAMDLRGAALNYNQKEALRSLQYGPAIKVGIKFKTAWWENDAVMKKLGAFGRIVGGQSYTDNMIRTVVYPSYGVDTDTPSTVLIASYAWTADALALTALMGNKQELRRRVLQDLVEVHNFNAEGAAFLESQWVDWFPYSWSTDPNTMGAYAFFGPGGFANLYKYLTSPAGYGRLHFAGEVISARHAWVVGALEASKRAVAQIVGVSRGTKGLDDFGAQWGQAEHWTQKTLMKQVAVCLEEVYGEFPPETRA